MKTGTKKLILLLGLLVMIFGFSLTALAASGDSSSDASAETTEESSDADSAAETSKAKAYAAGILLLGASVGGAVSMALSIRAAVGSIARQPEAAGNIRTTMMLGLVFIETAIIYALIIAILIIFVL